jgi:hypothetical protein
VSSARAASTAAAPAVVGLANVYMSLFGRLRVDIKAERLEIASKEKSLDDDSPPDQRE